ncbi:MAG: NAD(P)-dependent alcohol dehydrogenase [Planctomycetota bacterium]
MTNAHVPAYGAKSADSGLAPLTIPRRSPTDDDVQIEILFCGVCHSDIHLVRDEWHDVVPTEYPIVPGHEIVGRVTAVGSAVSKIKTGDLVGVGCLVDSDRDCPMCQKDFENLCQNQIWTYNAPDSHGTAPVTYGGYSGSIVTDQHFVLRIPENLDPAGAAPLLCAGITTYSPLRQFEVGKGQKVGIVGLGGLGHMGVKFAHAFGAHTVVLTTSPGKKEDAQRLGADEVIVSRNSGEMEKHAGTFDFILNTVSANHDLNPYLELLAPGGTLTIVGAPEEPFAVPAFTLLMGRRRIAGSNIGGLAETQEMLDFCGEHGITADVEVIPIDQINEAYERVLKADVRYRFCIDMASLKK